MSMLTLQVLGLLLLFGLLGALVGWLLRPYFCKPSVKGGSGNLSGSTVNGAVDNSKANANASKGGNVKTTAAAAGIAAVATTAAAVASSNKQSDADASSAKAKADADSAAKKAKANKQAAVEAEAGRTAEAADASRIAAEKAKATKLAEEQRIAVEKAKAAKLAEEQRVAFEKAKAAKLAEEQRLADEQAKAGQTAKLAAIEADKQKLAAEAQAARQAEADRLAAEKAKADQDAKDAAAKADADRLAAEKAKAEQDAKDAAAKADADRLAAEKAKAEQDAKDVAAKADAETANAAKIAAAAAVALAATAASSASADESTGAAGDVDYASVTDNMRPERLAAPRGGSADDLKRISGIGPVIEGTLNEEGVYHFQQIASFTPDNVKWVDKNVSIPGRVHRDDWMGQAQALIDGNDYNGHAKGIAGKDDSSLPAVTEDMRPARLSAPTGGKADDLKRISGVGPVIEKTLNEEGIYHFKQVADFTPDNVNWVDRHISFPGRITREEWIRQAKGLAAGEGDSGTAVSSESETSVITEDMRPTRRHVETGQRADDLKVINGIGPVIEKSLNEEGVYFYQQIADFDENNTKWVDNHMAFPGRIHREDWIGQAKVLIGQKADPQAEAKPKISAVGSALGSSGAVPDSMKPTLLTAPEGGKADDLKRVKGIGKVLEKTLHTMGIYHYEQLAALTPDNISWLTDYVSFPDGRINDENWTGQAKALAEGKQTEYSQRFDKGDTPYK